MYEKAMIEQRQEIEMIQRDLRSKNLIIAGVPEVGVPWKVTVGSDSNITVFENIDLDDGKILHLFSSLVPGMDASSVSDIRRLGQQVDGRPRLPLVKMNSFEMKRRILAETKKLKGLKELGDIYINQDLPPMTRRENQRLRKVMKDKRLIEPQSDIVIRKGKLLVNEVQIDEFDLRNQIFRNSF